jgi:hypothetical protein
MEKGVHHHRKPMLIAEEAMYLNNSDYLVWVMWPLLHQNLAAGLEIAILTKSALPDSRWVVISKRSQQSRSDLTKLKMNHRETGVQTRNEPQELEINC